MNKTYYKLSWKKTKRKKKTDFSSLEWIKIHWKKL